MRLKIRIGVVAVLAVIVAVLGVLVLMRTGSRSVAVREVAAKPDEFEGRVVELEGTVADATPSVAGFCAFRLTDGAASVWVVSRLPAPLGGARVVVHGRVATSLQVDVPVIESVNLGTFVVEERRDEP